METYEKKDEISLSYENEFFESCLNDEDAEFKLSMPNIKEEFSKCIADDILMQKWKELAGVKTNDNSFADFADKIIFHVQQEFDNIQICWMEDCYGTTLVVNGVKTKIRKDYVKEAYATLKWLTSEEDIEKIIIDLMIKKLKNLF